MINGAEVNRLGDEKFMALLQLLTISMLRRCSVCLAGSTMFRDEKLFIVNSLLAPSRFISISIQKGNLENVKTGHRLPSQNEWLNNSNEHSSRSLHFGKKIRIKYRNNVAMKNRNSFQLYLNKMFAH